MCPIRVRRAQFYGNFPADPSMDKTAVLIDFNSNIT